MVRIEESICSGVVDLLPLEPEELADTGGIPPVHVLIAFRHNRHAHQAKGLQLLEGRRVIFDISDVELDAAPRKHRLRHGAAASAGAGKYPDLFSRQYAIISFEGFGA